MKHRSPLPSHSSRTLQGLLFSTLLAGGWLLFLSDSIAANYVYYWDLNGATAGATNSGTGAASGNWDGTTANWSTSAAGTAVTVAVPSWADNNFTNSNTISAVFSAGTSTNLATGSSTINLQNYIPIVSAITIAQGTLTFAKNATGRLVFRGTNTLTLGANADGSATFNVDVTFGGGYPTQTWTNENITAGRNLIYNGNIRVSGDTSTQASLTLSNTSAGGTTINGLIGTADTDGSTSASTRVTNLIIHNTGSGVTTFTATNPYTGSTTITAGTLVVSGSGSINGTSGVLLNHSTATLRYSSSVALTKTVTFGINGGTFLYNSSAKYTGGSGSITADTGDTIGGGGALGNVTIASGGSLTPGAFGNNSIGNLTVDSLTLQNGSSTFFDIASAGSFDSITSTGAKVMDGDLHLNLAMLLDNGNSLAFFLGAGGLSGQFDSIHATGAYGSQTFIWSAGTQEFTLTTQNQLLSFGADGVLNVAAIPEPSAAALFLISGMVVLFLRRRSFGR